jgi:hypothetical protein
MTIDLNAADPSFTGEDNLKFKVLPPPHKTDASLVRSALGNMQHSEGAVQLLTVVINWCAEKGSWTDYIPIQEILNKLPLSKDPRTPGTGQQPENMPRLLTAFMKLASEGYVVPIDDARFMVTRSVGELLRSIMAR